MKVNVPTTPKKFTLSARNYFPFMRAPFSSFIIYTPTSISPPPLIHSHSLSFGHTSHPASTTFKIMGAETKVFTLAEVSQHNNPKDCWLVIDGKVYDVTKFLEEHPGGDEVLLNATGKDATDDFDDVGHSNSAREMLVEFYVGDIDSPKYSKKTTSESPKQLHSNQGNSSEFIIKLLQILVPLAILGLAFGIRFYTKSTSA